MARIPLVCPIDGTNLGAPNQNLAAAFSDRIGDPDQPKPDVEQHLHLTFVFDLTCSNGHRWRADANVVLERVS